MVADYNATNTNSSKGANINNESDFFFHAWYKQDVTKKKNNLPA